MSTRKKKKAKKKKKKRSIAWKNLEKHVASFLNGTRILRGFNFSVSLPDVVANANYLNIDKANIIVECKHSKNQPFVDLLKDTLTDNEIVCIDSYIFWDFAKTKEVITNYIALGQQEPKQLLHTIPQYIDNNMKQALGYTLEGILDTSLHKFRMVVIAKKNCATRIAYTSKEELKLLCNHVSLLSTQKKS